MAGKSNKTVVPENVLRDVFITGLREIKRAGIEVRAHELLRGPCHNRGRTAMSAAE